MRLFYGYQGARYETEELYQTYLAHVENREKELKRELSIQYSHEAHPEIPIEEVFAELYRSKGVMPDQPLILHTGQMFRACSTKFIRLYAYAEELLLALKEAGRGVYLLSNAQRVFTEYELNMLGICDLFDGILISSDHGCKKPDERFFRILMERYGLSAEKSLMIGNDHMSDIAGAKQVGMDSFYIHSAISPRLQADMDLKDVNADYVMGKMDLRALANRLLARE